MKKYIFGFVSGFILSATLFTAIGANAQDIYQSVSVVFDSIRIKVNGEEKKASNLVYNGSTYIKLRDLSTLFGKEVEWDGLNSIAYIDEKDAVKLTGTNPLDKDNNYYPKYGYIAVAFDRLVKNHSSTDTIYLRTASGDRVNIVSAVQGSTQQKCLVLSFEGNLKINASYTLFIPRDTLVMDDGKKYLRDINLSFKTPATVAKGRITSNVELEGASLSIGDKNIPLYSDGVFSIGVSNCGTQKLKVTTKDKKVFEKDIFIQEDMLNTFSIYANF